MKLNLAILSILAISTVGTLAHAADPEPVQDRTIDRANRTGTLPPSQSDDDAKPPVPMPMPPPGGLVKQAGIGGVTSYGRSGVLELGGSASIAAASGYLQLSIAPSIGYFIIDNIRLSAIMGLSYTSIDVTDDGGATTTATQTLFSLLFEPSVHIPFTESLFGFLGVGLGVSYADESGAGFALQPRLGLNVLVGRSGVLSPAIYVQYTTTSAIQTDAGTLLQVNFGYGLNLGYTVMW